MGRDLLPKRPCADDSRPMDVAVGGGEGGAGGGGRSIHDDVLFFVGKRRQENNVSAESLIRGSLHFRNLLQHSAAARVGSRGRSSAALARLPPVVMDCDETVFESMLLLMRYGTWEALSPMSEAEIFRLKREAEFYGVQCIEPPPPPPRRPKTPAVEGLARTNSRTQGSTSGTSSPTSSPGGSPKSDTNTRPPASKRLSGRCHDSVWLAGSTSRQLNELPDFPLDLSDPTKLVLVACLDEKKSGIYACTSCNSARARTTGAPIASPTQWALSFHHRHAFCTACGQAPDDLAPKYFAEMFTAAAAQFHSPALEQAPVKANSDWCVGCDSTCTLRFVGGDVCSSARCSASAAPPHETYTVWAANFFYSHAFCTHCGQPAPAPVLLSLLLALRYGGAVPTSKSARSSFKISATTAAPADLLVPLK